MNPRHGLTHPLWWGALLLLVVNDHFLKSAVPSWLTGKLSDVAGMVVAPLLCALVARVSTRRGWTAAHLAVGAVFAAINLSPAAARAFEALMALTPFPWAIVVDPSDLLALPALFVSHRWLDVPRPGWERGRRMAEGAALVAGSIACMATSPPPCEGDECGTQPEPVAPLQQAALVLGNATSSERLVRVRALRGSVSVDCETMLADPSHTLHPDLFADAQAWLVAPGRGLPLLNYGACSAFLVDAQGLAPVLLAWSRSQFPDRTLPTVVDSAPTSLVMREAGGSLSIDAHPVLFEPPTDEDALPPAGCETPHEYVGIDWSTPPVGDHTVVSIASSPDGCHMIELDDTELVACLPLQQLPFAAGDTVTIYPWAALGDYPEAQAVPATANGIVIHAPAASLWAVRGNVLARPSDSGLYDPSRDYDASVEYGPGCGLHHDECGNAVAPLTVTLLDAGVDGLVSGGAGDTLLLDDAGTTLHLVRAQHMPIRDVACAPFATQDTYFESVLVKPAQEM